MTYRSYPGFTQTVLGSELDGHLENLRILGYSLMKNLVPRAEAARFESKLVKLWAEQEREFGKKRLEELNEVETHRGLLEADPDFAELVTHPRVLEVVAKTVGPTAILNLQNASAAFPERKHWQSAFHRDFAKDFVADKMLSVNAFWCLTDFTAENGATWVVPFSHRDSTIPSEAFAKANAIQLIAPAGSVLLWDSLLLHKAGLNSTAHPRYGINHMYTRPFIKQQLDFPVYLRGKFDPESKLGQLLGFWSIPPKSVKEYRVDPDKRTYRSGQG